MNKTYRIKYNQHTGAYVAVAEISTAAMIMDVFILFSSGGVFSILLLHHLQQFRHLLLRRLLRPG